MALRMLLIVASLYGAAGVILLAAGAHATGGQATTAGQMLLFHASALLAGATGISAGRLRGAIAGPALWALALGVALFSGDLALRSFQLGRLFANAAPTGGLLAIAGWLGLAVAATFTRR